LTARHPPPLSALTVPAAASASASGRAR